MDTTIPLRLTVAAILAAPAVGQGLTVVNEPWPGEASHSQMLSDVFGGSFASMGEVGGFDEQTGGSGVTSFGYTNGSVSAMRIGDLGSGVSLGLGGLLDSMGDQSFGAGSYEAQVIGHNSSVSHEFGTMDADGNFRSLLSSSDQTDTSTIHPKGEFTWAIQTANGQTISSDSAFNGGVDHMVTYALLDENDEVFGAVVFFEDWLGGNGDFDFNDLGVLLTLAPTPNAALLGLAGLGGLGFATGRRRR
ncbi:MAG: hypothetical protein AAGF47_03165 [Planctomycetota bacterium]